MRFLKPLPNSAPVQQKFPRMTCKSWKTLLSSCMIDQVLVLVSMKQGWISLPESRDPVMQSHQPVDPLKNMQSAAYQAGIIWSQATVSNPELDSPADWGWTQKGETWQIYWTTLPPIAAQLPGTDQVFLQERLQTEMQMLSFRPVLNSSLQLRV